MDGWTIMQEGINVCLNEGNRIDYLTSITKPSMHIHTSVVVILKLTIVINLQNKFDGFRRKFHLVVVLMHYFKLKKTLILTLETK